MEVLFLDVGFGTSNLILTGSGSAIVIDVGKQFQQTRAALSQFSVSRIEHLILSHWHADHIGGGRAFLRAFSGRIGKIWFPFDDAFKRTTLWDEVVEQVRIGALSEENVKALQVDSPKVRPIWASAARGARLEIISPCFMEVMTGVAAGDPNATCGILVLRVGKRAVVFGGDALLSQWQSAKKRVGEVLEADVLAVPHHAGIIWPANLTPRQIEIALEVLYSQVVKPKVAIISTGTKPGVHHPRADVIRALKRAGAKVMCAQMTKRCTSNLEGSRTLQSQTVQRSALGRSSPLRLVTSSGASNHVACAGSVLVEITATGLTVHQLSSHDAFVRIVPTSAKAGPMCL